MKNMLLLEEIAMWVFSLNALYFFAVPWWVYILLLIGPDISMLGYAAGNKIGATTYNLFHHKGVAIILFTIGVVYQINYLQVMGILLFGHSSMDRVFGYGLKYFTGFGFTHLGKIGRDHTNQQQ